MPGFAGLCSGRNRLRGSLWGLPQNGKSRMTLQAPSGPDAHLARRIVPVDVDDERRVEDPHHCLIPADRPSARKLEDAYYPTAELVRPRLRGVLLKAPTLDDAVDPPPFTRIAKVT